MKRWMCLTAVLVLMFVSSAACAQQRGDLATRFAMEPSLTWQGETYRLRKRLTTILLLGVDQSGFESSVGSYRNGGQADFQLLLVVDDNRKTITPLQLDRDTITDITVLSVLGKPTGSRRAQLALAHGFGDGRELSCRLAVSAVETLLSGTPVNEYYAMNMDGIAPLNDALGGVEVTLEDDFSAYDAAMTPGVTLRLQGMQAEYYVRHRYYVGDQTNASRLSRQKIYLLGAKDALTQRLNASAGFAGKLFDTLAPYTVTSMTRGYLINLAGKASEYQVLPIQTVAGSHSIGANGFMEFHADEDALLEQVIALFYEPAPY